MNTAIVASLTAALALGLVEALGRFYPAKRTWLRLRSKHGRRAVWAMRARFEQTATRRAPRVLALVLLGLVLGWVASASLLDKRWYEVVFDVTPYLIVDVALIRTPVALRRSAERMKRYEDEHGDDPQREIAGGNGDPTAIAL